MNNNYPSELLADNQNKYYIVFSIKSKKYAISIKNVIEVINIPQIDVLQKTPQGIIGTINYNGMIINVVDLCPFLGIGYADFSINNKLIIVEVKSSIFSIHTENIVNITQFESDEIQKIPYMLENYIIEEIYTSENIPINIINIDKLETQISDKAGEENKFDYKSVIPSDEKSNQILSLRTQQNEVAQRLFDIPLKVSSLNQYILFILDGNNYFLDLKNVKEFISIKKLNITKLPYTPDYIKGIINLKGEFLIVLDLKCFLNNESTPIKQGSKLIVAEGTNFNIAFLVDELKYIKDLKSIPKDDLYTGNSKYIISEFSDEGELYSILNFEKIINDERIFINID